MFCNASHSGQVNFTIMEQLLLVDALKEHLQKNYCCASFLPYSRQDKKALPREPISARLVADLFIAAGAEGLSQLIYTPTDSRIYDQPFDP